MKVFLPLMAFFLVLHTMAAGTPLDREKARLNRKGYRIQHSVSSRIGKEKLLVALVAKDTRADLRIYRITSREAKLLHMAPGFGKTIRLAAIHDGGTLPERAGARVIAYIGERKSTDQSTLTVYLYAGGKLEKAGDFPGGVFSDLDGDGESEVLTRSRPLGLLFNIDCEDVFHSLARNAFRTKVYKWQGTRLIASSREFADFYRIKIAETDARLDSVDIRSTDRYGDYLGDALSVFFLHEELGEKKIGWEKLKTRFPIRTRDLPPVKRCYQKLRRELKEKLAIPQDW